MPEAHQVILVLISVFGLLGFIGYLSAFIPVLNMVPFLFSVPHSLFLMLAGFISPFLKLVPSIVAVILELGIGIGFLLIAIKTW